MTLSLQEAAKEHSQVMRNVGVERTEIVGHSPGDPEGRSR